MDMYLSAKEHEIRIPLLPNKLTVKKNTTSISFQIIKIGEHKIPRGTSVTGYSWTGVFPGESMSNLGFVFDWREPKELIEQIQSWQNSGEILDFTVTGTGIKDKVFIESFTSDYQGKDNVNYTINLSAYRKVTVTTAPPQPKVVIPVETQTAQPAAQPATKGTYTPPRDTGDGDKDDDKPTFTFSIPTSKLVESLLNTTKTSLDSVFASLDGNKKKDNLKPQTLVGPINPNLDKLVEKYKNG